MGIYSEDYQVDGDKAIQESTQLNVLQLICPAQTQCPRLDHLRSFSVVSGVPWEEVTIVKLFK